MRGLKAGPLNADSCPNVLKLFLSAVVAVRLKVGLSLEIVHVSFCYFDGMRSSCTACCTSGDANHCMGIVKSAAVHCYLQGCCATNWGSGVGRSYIAITAAGQKFATRVER